MVNKNIFKILVVDDFEIIRKIHVKNLQKMGYENIDQCEDGEKALHAISQKQYDLILLDWHMPVLDGKETLKIIRERGLTIPVVMCTDEVDQESIQLAKQMGVNAYITKPYSPSHFMKVILETLEKN